MQSPGQEGTWKAESEEQKAGQGGRQMQASEDGWESVPGNEASPRVCMAKGQGAITMVIAMKFDKDKHKEKKQLPITQI